MRVPYGRLEGIMSKNENRLNFRMTDETAAKIERWYQEDNCRSTSSLTLRLCRRMDIAMSISTACL